MSERLPIAGGAEVRANALSLFRRHRGAFGVVLGMHALAAVAGLAGPRILGGLVEDVQEGTTTAHVNRVILVSDGLANVGPSTPSEVASLGRDLAGKGISVTTIGLGLDYNEDLMQRWAAASDGNHAFVESPRQLASSAPSTIGGISASTCTSPIVIAAASGFHQ